MQEDLKILTIPFFSHSSNIIKVLSSACEHNRNTKTWKKFPSEQHITAVISMYPVIYALKRLEMQIKCNIILPVYFGCYDHCKISFCIGQVSRRYNDITSSRKPAKSADFLGIAVRNTAHHWLQVDKRSTLWFPAAVRHLQKKCKHVYLFIRFRPHNISFLRHHSVIWSISIPNTHSAVQG